MFCTPLPRLTGLEGLADSFPRPATAIGSFLITPAGSAKSGPIFLSITVKRVTIRLWEASSLPGVAFSWFHNTDFTVIIRICGCIQSN